jgi:hypothetical protein
MMNSLSANARTGGRGSSVQPTRHNLRSQIFLPLPAQEMQRFFTRKDSGQVRKEPLERMAAISTKGNQ